MKRIVIDARELRTSSGRYVERLLHYLQLIDHENEYRVLLKPQDAEGWQPSNNRFSKIICPYKEFSFGEQLGLKRLIKRQQADLVHFPFAQQPILYRGRVVSTVHDLTALRFDNPSKNMIVFRFKQHIYRLVIKRVLKKSVAIITGSQFAKKDLVNFSGVSPDKITVTLEAADAIIEPAQTMPELEGKPFIMYVGRPMPHKNLERLIEAFALLKGQHPDLVLVLAGKKDSNYARVEAMVTSRGIANVVFTDFVSEGQLRWLYEQTQAYVFPSLSEGFGLPGLEAMMHGAPVVSSNASCLPEIYGDAAHYFDPLDVQSMSHAINEVLTNQELRQTFINNGKAKASEYSWQRTAAQTLEVYKRAG
ncbi:MAG: glycosyltransferase family 1 protein [Patescibacteria group bacterium]